MLTDTPGERRLWAPLASMAAKTFFLFGCSSAEARENDGSLPIHLKTSWNALKTPILAY
jgi:hypothetical protein